MYCGILHKDIGIGSFGRSSANELRSGVSIDLTLVCLVHSMDAQSVWDLGILGAGLAALDCLSAGLHGTALIFFFSNLCCVGSLFSPHAWVSYECL